MRSPHPANVTTVAPGEGVDRDTKVVENATLSVDGYGSAVDLLFFPDRSGPTVTAFSAEGRTEVASAPDGLDLVDGYRERYPDGGSAQDGSDDDFDWSHRTPGPLVRLAAENPVELSGAVRGYAWDVNATLADDTGTIATYETGSRIEERADGTSRYENHTYVLFQATGVQARIPTEGLDADLYGPAMRVHVNGTARLPAVQGTLRAGEGAYHAPGDADATLEGDLSLDVTPDPRNAADGLTVGVDGTVADSSIPLRGGTGMGNGETVAAAAGGVTAVGLVAWYAASAEGIGLAAVPLVSRPARREPEPAEIEVDADPPGELLFDPDRFALYHLVRSRPGLAAHQCREVAGVPDAGRQLELMADHGLLEVVGREPRRYMLPGALDETDAARMRLVREDGGRQLAEILSVHGLASRQRILDRLEASEAGLAGQEARGLIERFVDRGLAYREQGPEGPVIDSTDELFELLETLGETSVPRVS